MMNQRIFRIALVAFSVRLLFILVFPGPNYFEGISRGYLDVASNIYEGRGIVTRVDLAPSSSPEPQWSYEKMIERPLGYLFLILLPYYFFSAVGIQVLQAALAACSAVLLFKIGQGIASEVAARRAALAYAIWPLSARFEITVLPDAVMSFFLLLTVWWLVKALTTENRNRWFILSGLACGVGMTVRADIMVIPLFIFSGIFFFLRTRQLMVGMMLFLAGIGIMVAIHTARNYDATGGKIVPLGLGNGISMWEGISQFGDTLGTVFGDERLVAREGYRQWAYPNGVERDRKRFSEAVGIVLAHPDFYAVHMLKRIPVLLIPDWIMTNKFHPSLKTFLSESPGSTIPDFVKQYPLASLLRMALIILQLGTLLLATVAVLRTPREAFLWIPAAVISYYIVIHLPTNTEARYFYPAIPFSLLLASIGWDRLRAKSSAK
jgi:hypothetical protein